MMRLRRRQRIRSTGFDDFKPRSEPWRVRGANRISVEPGVLPYPARACSSITKMNGDDAIRLARLNEHRRDDFPTLISQLNLVGDYLASNSAKWICGETVDVLPKTE